MADEVICGMRHGVFADNCANAANTILLQVHLHHMLQVLHVLHVYLCFVCNTSICNKSATNEILLISQILH